MVGPYAGCPHTCKKQPKKKRTKCEAKARKKYGSKAKGKKGKKK